MDRFLCIQAFVRVAETHSFATAARQLGVTPSVITSRIKQLEGFVQAPLFHRSTRKVMLSETAKAFFGECVELLARVDSITDRMRLTQDTPLGLLRLQVIPGFALGPFALALQEFTIKYPHIGLDITVSDQSVNPIDEGYDVALQIFRPGAELLIERHLFTVRRVFCASPEYLMRRGTPISPSDLLKHDIGLYSAYPTRNRWTFRRADEEVNLELPARIHSNSVHLLRDFARIGGGVTCLPTLVCSDDLINGSLVPLLMDYEMPPLELLAIYPTTHRGTVKVKLFVDFIRSRFSGEPEWDRALHGIEGFATPLVKA
ncbi:MAG: LysR family transcriptional regulator [Steroidobacteraceae bacterium]|jgi:DNA-binding transcriptional LysR family regulator